MARASANLSQHAGARPDASQVQLGVSVEVARQCCSACEGIPAQGAYRFAYQRSVGARWRSLASSQWGSREVPAIGRQCWLGLAIDGWRRRNCSSSRRIGQLIRSSSSTRAYAQGCRRASQLLRNAHVLGRRARCGLREPHGVGTRGLLYSERVIVGPL